MTNQHILMSAKQGGSVLSKTAAPAFNANDFPEGWSGAGVEASGVFMFVLNIAEGAAEFAIHASEDAWLAYVVSGSGTLYAGDAHSQKTEALTYQAGDYITFEAHTPHGWVNDGAESILLFVKPS